MVNQRKYALELLTNAGLLAYKPTPTPIDNHEKFSSTGSVPFTDIQAYRRLIGRLMYLTNTRPDITFYVQQLSQFLAKPTISHYNAAIRILRYIKGAPSLLFFSSTTSVHLKAFRDSDWGTCSDSRQLVIGFSVCILGILSYLGNQRNKEQCQRVLVKLNTGAMATVTCEIIQWLTYVLQDFKVPFEQPSLLYRDNDSQQDTLQQIQYFTSVQNI